MQMLIKDIFIKNTKNKFLIKYLQNNVNIREMKSYNLLFYNTLIKNLNEIIKLVKNEVTLENKIKNIKFLTQNLNLNQIKILIYKVIIIENINIFNVPQIYILNHKETILTVSNLNKYLNFSYLNNIHYLNIYLNLNDEKIFGLQFLNLSCKEKNLNIEYGFLYFTEENIKIFKNKEIININYNLIKDLSINKSVTNLELLIKSINGIKVEIKLKNNDQNLKIIKKLILKKSIEINEINKEKINNTNLDSSSISISSNILKNISEEFKKLNETNENSINTMEISHKNDNFNSEEKNTSEIENEIRVSFDTSKNSIHEINKIKSLKKRRKNKKLKFTKFIKKKKKVTIFNKKFIKKLKKKIITFYKKELEKIEIYTNELKNKSLLKHNNLIKMIENINK